MARVSAIILKQLIFFSHKGLLIEKYFSSTFIDHYYYCRHHHRHYHKAVSLKTKKV